MKNSFSAKSITNILCAVLASQYDERSWQMDCSFRMLLNEVCHWWIMGPKQSSVEIIVYEIYWKNWLRSGGNFVRWDYGFSSTVQLLVHTVGYRYNVVHCCKKLHNNFRNWGRISIRCWIHRRQPISCPNGRAVGRLLLIFCEKIDWVITAPPCILKLCIMFVQIRVPKAFIHHYVVTISPDKCPRRVNR